MVHIDYGEDDLGRMVSIEEIDKHHRLFEQAITERETMIDALSNYDDKLGDLYLSEEICDISHEAIDRAVCKAVASGKAVPLLCGSALKNKGV